MQDQAIKEIQSASSAPQIGIESSSFIYNCYPQDMSKAVASAEATMTGSSSAMESSFQRAGLR